MGSSQSRPFVQALQGVLQARDLALSECLLWNFMKEVDRVAPWFLHSGSLNVPSWDKLEKDLLRGEEQGTLRQGTLPVWTMIRSCLNDKSCAAQVQAGQKVLSDHQDSTSESDKGRRPGKKKRERKKRKGTKNKNDKGKDRTEYTEDRGDSLFLSEFKKLDISEDGSTSSSSLTSSSSGEEAGEELDSEEEATAPPLREQGGARPKQVSGSSFIRPRDMRKMFLSFPVFENNNQQRYHEPLQHKQLKDLAESVRSWGVTASFTIAQVERLGNLAMTPDDWSNTTRACLTTGQYLDWKSIFQEGCMNQARANAQQGQAAWNYDMLTGQGQWLLNQTNFPPQVYAQINSIAIKAWKSLPNRGEVRGNLTKVIQGPTEPFSDFVARLVEAAGKVFGDLETAMPLIEQLAFEQCTTECRNAIAPWKNKGLNAWLKACREIGGPLTNSGLAAAVLAAQKGKDMTCYNCGKPGHLKRQCRLPKQERPQPKVPGICPTCQKGRHWASECRSTKDIKGRPINRSPKEHDQQKNGNRGPRPQGPQIYGVMQSTPVPSLAPPGSRGEPLKVPQDWTSVPPPQQY
nr:igE-binding protein-like [Microcebus murinus]